MLGDVNKLFVLESLLTTPSNVLPLHLKQTFLPIIWIFTEGESDGSDSRQPFKIFSTLTLINSFSKIIPKFWQLQILFIFTKHNTYNIVSFNLLIFESKFNYHFSHRWRNSMMTLHYYLYLVNVGSRPYTAKKILERLGIQTSSSFVKIW